MKKYIDLAEAEHKKLEKSVEIIDQYFVKLTKNEKSEIINSLKVEVGKGDRYRAKIAESGVKVQQDLDLLVLP